MVGSQAKRNAVSYLRSQHGLSERRACELSITARSTCRYQSKNNEESLLVKRLKVLAYKRRTFGYRRLHALLRREGFEVNHKRVYRLYREAGLLKRKRKNRKVMNRSSNPLKKAEKANQRWAMDFMSDSCENGNRLRTLNILDTFTRECPSIEIGSSLPTVKVIKTLDILADERGLPEAITVDNGPEYTSKAIERWAAEKGVVFEYITPGRPMENGFIESFNGKFREECLDQNSFRNISEAKKIIELWRQDYNKERPHSSLGYMTPEEFAEKNMTKTVKRLI